MVTQFDKDDVEAVGLVKFDFLGLRTLTIIDWAVKAINVRRARTRRGAARHRRAADWTTRRRTRCSSAARPSAMFQLESRGMRACCKEAQAGPLRGHHRAGRAVPPGPDGPDPELHRAQARTRGSRVSRTRARADAEETYGIMVYQEQVMQMAQIVGGYSLGGADLLRRAMGKKKAEEMAKQRATFRDGAAKNGLERATRPTRSST